MSAVLNLDQNTLVLFSYCITDAIHTRSSSLVRCEHILRFIRSTCTISTMVPKINTATTLKKHQQVRMITDYTFMLVLQQLSSRPAADGSSRRRPRWLSPIIREIANSTSRSPDWHADVAQSLSSNYGDSARPSLPP